MRTKFNIPSMYFILLQYMQKTFVDLCIFIINIKYKKFYQYSNFINIYDWIIFNTKINSFKNNISILYSKKYIIIKIRVNKVKIAIKSNLIHWFLLILIEN